MSRKNVLLVYPENPVTFWKFDMAMRIAGRKSAFPPWGLLTVAGDIPEDRYNLKLVDLNCEPLREKDLQWADALLTSGMIIHQRSMAEIIRTAIAHGIPVMAGGPYPTHYHDQMPGDAVFFQGESEAGFLDILDEMTSPGYVIKRQVIDREGGFESLEKTPLPRVDLIKKRYYSNMIIQVTRGCPNSCTFCDIPALFGRSTRLKTSDQVTAELTHLYDNGWRGNVMFADDNLTGNQTAILPILKAVQVWQQERKYPFSLFTQASLDMYDNPELIEAMYQAGFNEVFIGLESPDAGALKFMGAQKNLRGHGATMLEKIKTLQRKYFQVQAGFILGLDPDPDNIAQVMKRFIQESNIGTAMVGTLGIMRRTPDWARFKKQNRLKEEVLYAGDSGILSRDLNYIPRRANGEEKPVAEVLRNQEDVVTHTYAPAEYFGRIRRYFMELERKSKHGFHLTRADIMAFLRSLYIQGIRAGYRWEYWKFLIGVLLKRPRSFAHAVAEAIKGHHLILRTQHALQTVQFRKFLNNSLAHVQSYKDDLYQSGTLEQNWNAAVERLDGLLKDQQKRAAKLYASLHQDFRPEVAREYEKFLETLQEMMESVMAEVQNMAQQPA